MSALDLRLGVWVALAFVCLLAYRWMRTRSASLAGIFAVGVVLRVVIAAALLSISIYGWPIRRSLQLGGGFWALAPDARTYFDLSSAAVDRGLRTISDLVPSPFYVRALTAWMDVFGVSPATAVALNILCYIGAAASIVAIPGEHSGKEDMLGKGIALAGLTFSPALLIFSAQPLKDALCATLIIGTLAAGRVWWMTARDGEARQASRAAGAALAMALGIYAIAGTRAYVAAFTILAVGGAAFYCIAWPSRGGSRSRSALQQAVLIVLLSFAFMKGAGPFGTSYESYVASAALSPSTTIGLYDTARAGFVSSGGATSVQFEFTPPSTFVGKCERLAQGSLVLFVPISLLRWTSVVRFAGGEGLLLITDVDTILVDATIIAGLYLLLVSARYGGISPSSVFALVLAMLTVGSLAYVVTNYGTLFRLRLLGVAPFWMLAALYSGRRVAAVHADGQGHLGLPPCVE